MNQQLIEDLSKLNQQTMNIVVFSFKVFTLITSQFLKFINGKYKQNIKVFFYYKYLKKTLKLHQNFINFLFKTTKLNHSIETFDACLIQKINGLNTAFNRQSLLQSTLNLNEMNSTQNFYPVQTEDERKKLLSKYSSDKLYIVTQKYIANPKLCQLNQNINDLVGLKIDHDPANQKHIWFDFKFLGILNY